MHLGQCKKDKKTNHGSLWFIHIKDAVHLQYLRGMQSSDLPGILLTGYHFSVDGI